MTGGDGGALGGGVRSAEGRAGRVPTVDRFPGLHLPDWFQTLGRGAWLLVGIAVLLAVALLLLGLISDLVIPLVLGELVQALVNGLLSGLGSVTVLIVGIVTGLFILLFLMKDWQLVTDGTAHQLAALLGSRTGWAARSWPIPSTGSGAMPWG